MVRLGGVLKVFTAVLLAVSAAAQAAVLGSLTVSSRLGEPFEARLEVNDVSPRAELRVRIAPPARYARLSKKSTPEIQALRADLKGMNPCVVRIYGAEKISARSFDLVIELSESGRLVSRSYAVSLPKRSGGVVIVAGEPVLEPVKLPLDPREYDVTRPLTVRPGMTSWAVATLYRPLYPKAAMAQILVGLVRANPDCFEGGRVNSLKVGCVLTKPPVKLVEDIPAAEAEDLVHKHPGRSALKAGAAPSIPAEEKPAPVQASEKEAGARPEAPAAPAPESTGQELVIPSGADAPEAAHAAEAAAPSAAAPAGDGSVTVQLERSGGSLTVWLAVLVVALAALFGGLCFWIRQRTARREEEEPDEKPVEFREPAPAGAEQFTAIEAAVSNRIASDAAAARGLPDLSAISPGADEDLPGIPDEDVPEILHAVPGGRTVSTGAAVQATLDFETPPEDEVPPAEEPPLEENPLKQESCGGSRSATAAAKLEEAKMLLSTGSTDRALLLLEQVVTEGTIEEKSVARALIGAFRRR